MWDNLTVDGFHFDSAAEYADAKKESETIMHIRAKMNLKNPETALKVYYKLLDRQSFHTVIGICFLKELRDVITSSNMVEAEELKTIHSPVMSTAEDSTEVGDENALENSAVASEYAESAEVDIPETTDEDQKPGDLIKKLNRNLSEQKSKETKAKNLNLYLRSKIKKLYIAIAALAIVIAILFAIAVHNNNLIFVDEEVALQDKYSAWEEDLKSREETIKLREKELGISEGG